jgi:hypothetical protein
MRVFCHEHKRGFFAPRQSPIKCENRGHVLGELDFLGEGKSSFPFQWQYCCNCEHFCVIDFHDNGLQRCPVCTRRSSSLYLCDRCYTVSFESNTPLQTKNFTLTSESVPQPCCPGCLQSASADLREHTCDEARVSFVTGLNSCPICSERLDIGPSFPSAVAQYLRRTKSANKVYVTFDYESGLFVPVEDGEFVLISNNDESGRTIVLPRSPRLETRRDFYELYQDYYYCAAPDAGEINVSEPAVVVQTPEGWKLLARGMFVIVNDQPKKITPATVASKRSDLPGDEQQQSGMAQETGRRGRLRSQQEETAEEQQQSGMAQDAGRRGRLRSQQEGTEESVTACANCQTPIEAKYAFCWKCGYPRTDKSEALENASQHRRKSVPELRPERSRLIVSSLEADEEEPTVQHENRSMRSPMFAWSSSATPQRQTRNNASVLKLFSIAGGGVLLLSLTLFALLRSNSSSTSLTAAESAAPTLQNNASVAVPAGVEMKPASMPVSSTSAEDSALARLRQLRIAADSSDRSKILQNFSETEMKYADDYRFPYERARVVVKNRKKNFQKEAFAALSRAAQKAISKGKAREMLQSLNKDSNGDFEKLSHGHREWEQLQKALKSKDASMLSVNEGL